MKLIENIKLRYRAHKYKTKNDPGGIDYILSSVLSNQTVLDIGAHKAGYLYFLRKKVGHDGKVYAFEPQTNLYEYLQKIKSQSNWENVTIEHLALSDSSSEVTLFIPTNKVKKGSSPGATIVEEKGRMESGITEQVRTQTLDQYCFTHHIQPHFLKIDVEGNELKVFKGGATIIQDCHPKILVEIEARHVGREKAEETFDYLKSLKYKGYFLHGYNHVPITEFSFDKFQNIDDPFNYCNNFIFE